MGLNRLLLMSLLAIKSDILESITNIGGPWGRGRGARAPPPQKKNFFYRIHNDLKSLFEKNKQIRKFRKISSKCVQNYLKILKNL